jgi:hypothetical protein
MEKAVAGHKIDRLSLKAYFEQQRARIEAIENWYYKTDEIVYEVYSIAPHVPLSSIRKAYLRERKNWPTTTVTDETFNKLFEQL